MTRFGLPTRVAMYGLVAACTFSSQPLPIEIAPQPTPPPPAKTPGEQLAALDALVPNDNPDAVHIADVRAILRAQDLEARGKRELAVDAWMEALKIGRGTIGQRALHGWIRSYAQNLGKQTDRQILARLLLVETHYGRVSPYMKDNGLISEAALIREIEKAAPEALLPLVGAADELSVVRVPTSKGIPSDDPLLSNASTRYCGLSNELQLRWESWLSSLDKPVRAYWDALILDCRRNYPGAADAYKEALPLLKQNRSTHSLALSAMARQINVQRGMGKREAVAETYNHLLDAWRLEGLDAKAFGMSTDEFALKQIDDTLWASRSIALTGNLERAKELAQLAQDLISRMFINSPRMSQRSREALGDFRAEAFQVLAFRVALERGEYDRALAINSIAMQSPDISAEWKERFLWLSGVYDYLAGNYAGAKRRWEQLLNSLRDESLRPQIYYWTARALRQMNQTPESDFYLKSLVQDYPTNFYAVVGLTIAGLPEPDRWRDVFANGDRLAQVLKNRKDFEIDNVRTHPRVGPALRRAEILVQAQVCDWARVALQELDGPSRRDFRLASNPDLYVYMSRLHYSCGNHVQAVSMTTDLSNVVGGFWQKWPEQLLVNFPTPYLDVARRQAISAGIEHSEILAVARQESTFRPEISSPAGALGLMQIMIPTADRLALQLKLPTGNMATRLLEPELNATLGAHYLKELRTYYKGNVPAIYGGYNAGEYAVDGWLIRRQTTDPAMWVELVPFQETKGYIRNVWRNVFVYNFIAQYDSKWSHIQSQSLKSQGS